MNKKIINALKKYKKIAIFCHIHPDFEALSSEYAFKFFIKENSKNKEVKILGDNHKLNKWYFPNSDKVNNDWFNEKFIAIILDTPNKDRISDYRWKKAIYIIKMDHHIFVEKIGHIEYTKEKSNSTCELIADLFFNSKLKISKECAKYLYIGIVGDSGRFEYQNTTAKTFTIA